jgi:hypothetical protein
LLRGSSNGNLLRRLCRRAGYHMAAIIFLLIRRGGLDSDDPIVPSVLSVVALLVLLWKRQWKIVRTGLGWFIAFLFGAFILGYYRNFFWADLHPNLWIIWAFIFQLSGTAIATFLLIPSQKRFLALQDGRLYLLSSF